MNRAMERFLGVISTIVLAAMLPVNARAQSADFKVTPVAVHESRQTVLVPTKRKSYFYNNSLNITLRFEGAGVAKATRYGKLQLTSAKDSTGADIKLSRSSSLTFKRLKVLQRNLTNVVGEKSPNTECEIQLRLELPNRGAKSLATLKGSMTFAVGKTEKVSIPVSKLQDLTGKNVEHPLLAKLGLAVKLERYSGKSRHSARFKVTGDKRDAVLSANFIDPAGKSKSFGSYVFRLLNYTTATASTSKVLPEGSTLQFVIETERKDIVVPFDLKDIPLK